jgi:aspartate-semialdehyde dehydrogenase
MTCAFTREFGTVVACDLDAGFLERCYETVGRFGKVERLRTLEVADGRTLDLPDRLRRRGVQLHHAAALRRGRRARPHGRSGARRRALAARSRSTSAAVGADMRPDPAGAVVRALYRVPDWAATLSRQRSVTRLAWQANRLGPSSVIGRGPGAHRRPDLDATRPPTCARRRRRPPLRRHQPQPLVARRHRRLTRRERTRRNLVRHGRRPPLACAPMRVGVVGATGQVGGVMRRLLAERGSRSTRSATSRRPGRPAPPCRGRDGEIVVEDAETADPSGLDIALFSAGATSSRPTRRSSPPPASTVIDNSSAWRMDPEVPLVVSEVNGHLVHEAPKGIIANPNCTTMAAMPVLKPLHDEAGLTRLIASTYQAVSGGGLAGVDELDKQARQVVDRAAELTHDGEPSSSRPGEVRQADRVQRAAVRRLATSTTARSRPTRSRSSATRAARSSTSPSLAVSGTCVRVPVFTGHSLSINAEFERPISVERALRAARRAPGVVVSDDPDPARSGRQGPVVRRPHPPGPGRARRPRPGAVRQQRQPPQGRGAQRHPDRRAASSAPSASTCKHWASNSSRILHRSPTTGG